MIPMNQRIKIELQKRGIPTKVVMINVTQKELQQMPDKELDTLIIKEKNKLKLLQHRRNMLEGTLKSRQEHFERQLAKLLRIQPEMNYIEHISIEENTRNAKKFREHTNRIAYLKNNMQKTKQELLEEISDNKQKQEKISMIINAIDNIQTQRYTQYKRINTVGREISKEQLTGFSRYPTLKIMEEE